MKHPKYHLAILTIAIVKPMWAQFSPTQASGALQLSPDGTTVYDQANGINWLANMNLAASNRFGVPLCDGSGKQPTCVNSSGLMNYPSASAWVQGMNAANYLGHSNWQLPTTPLVDTNCNHVGPGGGGNFGFFCTAAALASLYNTLGLKAPNTAVAIPNNTVGPFRNLQPYEYWSQSTASVNQGNATFSLGVALILDITSSCCANSHPEWAKC